MFSEVTAVNMSERSSHPDESQSEPPDKKKKSNEVTDAIQPRNNALPISLPISLLISL